MNEEPRDCDVVLGYYRGTVERFVEALIAAHLDDAVLEWSGGLSREVYDLLDERTAHEPELAAANRRSREAFRLGPVTFGCGPGLLPIEGDNLERLLAVCDQHGPFGMVEVNVRDDRGYLVRAHDVGDNEIQVSDRLAPETIERMRAVLGDDLGEWRPNG